MFRQKFSRRVFNSKADLTIRTSTPDTITAGLLMQQEQLFGEKDSVLCSMATKRRYTVMFPSRHCNLCFTSSSSGGRSSGNRAKK